VRPGCRKFQTHITTLDYGLRYREAQFSTTRRFDVLAVCRPTAMRLNHLARINMPDFSASPMEHLKAFALAFLAGILTALSCISVAKIGGYAGFI
jgi:hypothetical protein